MPEMIDDLEMYRLLVYTAQLIAKSQYARYFALKGGVVLASKIYEAGRMDFFRRTVDIDVHCCSQDAWNAFCRDCITLFNANPDGLVYKLIQRRANVKPIDNSDSLKFEVTLPNGRVVPFKMDMNIKSNSIVELSFSHTLNMQTYTALTSLSDKIVVVSSQKIYRRVKDLYDLCVLISLFDFKSVDIANMLRKKHNLAFSDLINMLTADNMSTLDHAYSRYSGIHNKPPLDTLVSMAKQFLEPLYCGVSGANVWRHTECFWVRE